MRAALVIYGSIDSRSGGYLYDRMLVNELESRGHDANIISLPLRRYPLGALDNLSSRTLEEMTGASPDVLLEDELCHPSLFMLNRRFRERSPAPIISIVHHLACSAERSARRRALSRALEKRYLGSVDAFVLNSNDSKEAVSGLLGKNITGVVACPGRDRAEIEGRAKDFRSGKLRLLYVGNILPHKGLDVLVRAVAMLKDEDVSLDVVGAPADRSFFRKVERTVRKEGLGDRIAFHGYVPRSALDEMLEDGHVLVAPSFHEGYGITCVEACCHGVPVIASDVGGLKETVPPEVGYRVPPGDPAALAGRISFLDHNRATLEALSSTAREHAASLPSWEDSMGRAVDFIEEQASRGRAPL